MNRLNVLRPQQRAAWQAVLARSFQYDFYHLPAYHDLAEARGEGRACLLVYTEGEYCVALPLLLRPVSPVKGLERAGQGWWDATCVYGYAGPIASHRELPAEVVANFQLALQEALRERQVVTVFSRLHPLIAQRRTLAGLGTCVPVGQTVSIDLTQSADVQWTLYRENHKRDIKKLARLSATCFQDQNGTFVEEFADVYEANMRRVNADDFYFFGRCYFERFISELKSHVHLFVCLQEDQVACAGIFSLCDGIAQYHLGGTRSDFVKLSPLKSLIDTVRLWANEQGAHTFHLGGGVGGGKDSLFNFKAGFSECRHKFVVWRWILVSEIYEQLYQERVLFNEKSGLKAVSAEYFPAYRCPTVAA